jgi:carbamoyl-phosphate synthase large subunit
MGIPVAKLAAKILVGRQLRELLAPHWPYPVRPGWPGGTGKFKDATHASNLIPTAWPAHSAVKEVVLPFGRFPGSDILLGPEMRSTGEVMSFGANFPEAFAKAQIAAGNPLPTAGKVLVSLADPDKSQGVDFISQLWDMGFELIATEGTARALQAMGLSAAMVPKVGEGRPDVVDLIVQGKINLVVNTPSSGHQKGDERAMPPLPTAAEKRGIPLPLAGPRSVGYRIRTAALDYQIPYVTSLVALRATVAAIRSLRGGRLPVRELGTVALGAVEA